MSLVENGILYYLQCMTHNSKINDSDMLFGDVKSIGIY